MATRKTSKSIYTQAFERLTRWLAIRDHSRFELQRKLSPHFPPDIVDAALSEAEARHWLRPDPEIAATAIALWQRKNKSHAYIEQQLLKRHLPVPPKDEEKELENVRQLVEKKFGHRDVGLLNGAERAAAFRFLRYRGFEEHTIRMVVYE